MNINTAIEYLDLFYGLFKNANPRIWYEKPARRSTLYLPLIHLYGLAPHTDEDKAEEYFAK